MSITSSLSNAISGLTAASRSAELVSGNVANAMTDGYGRREISLSSMSLGGNGAGVRVGSVERIVNETAIADRRLADASLGVSQQEVAFFGRVETLLGEPGDPASLAGRLASLEVGLIEAASNPSSAVRLNSVVTGMQSVAAKFNTISDGIQATRQSADQQIAQRVDVLNAGLANIDALNDEIQRQLGSGNDATALMDQRQVQIDEISSIVPVQTIARDNGKVALITSTGATLVDGRAAQFSFTPTPLITADMTQASGALSGLEMEGAASSFGDALRSVAGGELSALFETRDTLAVDAQSQIDAMARDFMDRLSDPAVDPSIGVGVAGVITDGGAAFDPLDEVGLAGRLEVNALVDPGQGGDVARLRDGLYAPAGPVGENGVLTAMRSSLSDLRAPASGQFDIAGSSVGLVSDFLSQIGTSRNTAEARQSFASAQVDAFRDLELADGVDTDQEMQKLLLIEKSFAANARVITTVDEMLDTLLRI
jgi:flagellar hook-associated protein 1 FlgK